MQQLRPLLPIPFRCIWCKKTPVEVTFVSESHALLAAAGNADEVLPPGVVCDACNRNLGKIERELSEYPLFKIGAWATHSRNVRTGKLFCPQLIDDAGMELLLPRKSKGGIRLGLRLNSTMLTVEATTSVKGTFTKKYTLRRLALLSRAVHKMAFEGLAWGMYCLGECGLSDQTLSRALLAMLSGRPVERKAGQNLVDQYHRAVP